VWTKIGAGVNRAAPPRKGPRPGGLIGLQSEREPTVVEPGVYRFPKMDGIVFGRPWTEVLPELVNRLGARRIFVLGSATLAAGAALGDTLSAGLGASLATLHVGIRAHTPRDDVIVAAAAARAVNADLIVTIGGSSVTDAGKMLQLCLAADIRVAAALDPWRAVARPLLPAMGVRMVSIPTTLSGAEFTALAGCTDLERRVKEPFAHPEMIPHTVILDPQITLHTPMPLWLSSGLRAVDHAVETLCAIHTQPLFEAAASRALALLARGLSLTKRDPADLTARLESQLGVWLSLIGPQAGAPMGASHGIGHALGGTAGVPHGVTSCIMLPHVLRWNKVVNADRQRCVAAALGEGEADAGDLIAGLVRRLELPSRLRDVGVDRAALPRIAQVSMHDRHIPTNPRRIEGPDDIMTLLEAAW
jgi:maleylacetate reductase